MCAINNMQPCLSEYLKQVVQMLTRWQMGALDNPGLFHKFSMHQFDTSGDLMVQYRNLQIHQYTWWKDWFDLMPFEVPNQLTMHEVIQLYCTHMQQTPAAHILLPEICRCAVGPDPLLNNVWIIRDDLEDLGTKLEDWLTEKIKDRGTTLEEMTRLKGPVDDLHDAIAASQQLLGADRGNPALGS
ncbi:hypothetical protein BDR03DRAFT_987171 [Suillus americanus]|nr:hypothetical protein BDR03DRAFT_987171 [Suillus americanus]